MKTEKSIIVLWIIFGFVCIHAIDSILFFLIHLIYLGTVTVGMAFSTLKIVLPILTVGIYLSTTFFTLNRIKANSGILDLSLTKLPKNQFFVLLLLAIVLQLITTKLSGLFAEWISSSLDHNTSEFLALYGFFHMGIGIARWASIIVLALVYLNQVRFRN
ncbi:MAG: hypothetical protein WBG42_06345 [Cryomorphaceae bacterium]